MTSLGTGTSHTLDTDSINDIRAGIVVAQDEVLNDQNIENVLVGGKVTGRVDISGSIDTFYAGALLTGVASGQSLGDAQDPGNFRVSGDLRNLIVRGSIGTDDDDGLELPQYVTGFDLVVDGKIGQVVSQDSYIGEITVNNQTLSSVLLPIEQEEFEFVGDPDSDTEGGQFQVFTPWRVDGGFENGTFETAQYVAPFVDAGAGGTLTVQMTGQLDGDPDEQDLVDYYALGLLAGQTVTVQLAEVNALHVGVFDPDGRLVASDDSNVDRLPVSNQAFQFTAERPGAYRFAVAYVDDLDFNGQLRGHTWPNPLHTHDHRSGERCDWGLVVREQRSPSDEWAKLDRDEWRSRRDCGGWCAFLSRR